MSFRLFSLAKFSTSWIWLAMKNLERLDHVPGARFPSGCQPVLFVVSLQEMRHDNQALPGWM